MQKRLSKDINQAAFQMVRLSTGTEDITKVTSSDISRVMAAMGRKGGKIGGKRRMVTMTPAERRAVAVKAAKTRWAKHNEKK
jgi:transposase-like protein